MNNLVRMARRALGIKRKATDPVALPTDLTERDRAIIERIRPYSMTSVERQATLIEAVRYVVRRGLTGCYVECGVWRGGSSMAAALAFTEQGDTSRHLYLFDTYEGMTPPTKDDKTADGVLALTHLERDVKRTGYWCIADIDDVQHNMASTGYPADRLHLVKGPVETTIPQKMPEEPIALLRLDTDWYESTRHELEHLFPRLVEGGVMIIDDYGHWAGARKAVDEYLARDPRQYYLHRIDYTGRLLIKQ